MNEMSIWVLLEIDTNVIKCVLTNVQKDGAIWFLVNNMVLEDLVVQRPGLPIY